MHFYKEDFFKELLDIPYIARVPRLTFYRSNNKATAALKRENIVLATTLFAYPTLITTTSNINL